MRRVGHPLLLNLISEAKDESGVREAQEGIGASWRASEWPNWEGHGSRSAVYLIHKVRAGAGQVSTRDETCRRQTLEKRDAITAGV